MQSEALPSFSRIWELSTRVWEGGTSVHKQRRRLGHYRYGVNDKDERRRSTSHKTQQRKRHNIINIEK
jgi:hypothetical protein